MSPTVLHRGTRVRRGLLARLLPATALCALALAGCGNEVAAGSVAKVGDTEIQKPDFDHWLTAVAKSSGPTQGAPAVVPDAPTFAKCVAAGQAQPVPKGAPKPNPAQLKGQCKKQYDELKQRVLQFLINAKWIEQEAEGRDVDVKDEEVRRSFDDQKRQAFPDDRQYRQFLAQSGQTEQDILYRLKLDLLVDAVRKKITEGKAGVTDQQVRDYYNRNQGRPPVGQPERREIEVVLAKDDGKAQAAKKAIESDTPFSRVVKRYSTDPASKGQGGKLTLTRGQQDKALDDAAFGAKQGELVGPVKTQFGSYVLRVNKIVPAKVTPLPQATEQIKQILRSQAEQKAVNDFVKGFEKKHREETVCAKGFEVSECNNGPPPRPSQATPGGSGGAAPQGGASGAPPSGSSGAPPSGGSSPAPPPSR